MEINYHTFDIGLQCASISWQYFGQACRPATYTLQAFSPSDLSSATSPRLILNSTSAAFKFPTSVLRSEQLYFKAFGVTSEGRICDPKPRDFHNFAMLAQGGVVRNEMFSSLNSNFHDFLRCACPYKASLCAREFPVFSNTREQGQPTLALHLAQEDAQR